MTGIRSPLSAADGSDVPGPVADIVAGDIGLQRDSEGLSGVNLLDSRVLWRVTREEARGDEPVGGPLVVGDTVFQSGFEGAVEARSLTTGVVQWRAKLRKASESSDLSGSGRRSSLAGGNGVLVALRGATVDGLASAAEMPRALSLVVPRMASRLIEAEEDELLVRATVAGEPMPERVQLETDAYPYDRFQPYGQAAGVAGPGELRLPMETDRNVRVRVVGPHNSTHPSGFYTYFAYPRIRLALDNVRNRVRASVSVRGSKDVRFRRRRVHVYIVRDAKKRLVKLGSARLSGPRTGRGRAIVRFRALSRVGKRDFLFACVPGVHRLGQGFGDPIQRRCGRTSIRY